MSNEVHILRPGRPKDAVKREEIVLAASRLFLQNGYELTSMEAVAKQAGVSKLTVYSHFTDKSELFRAIIHSRCERQCMPDSFLSLAALPPEQSLMQIAEQVAGIIFCAESIQLQRTILAEASRHPEMVAIFYESGPRRVRVAFTELLRVYGEKNLLAIPDPARATEHFFSLMKGEKLARVLLTLSPLPEADELAEHLKSSVACFLAAYSPRK